MALVAEVVEYTLNGSASSQNVSLSKFSSETPKVVFASLVNRTAAGYGVQDQLRGTGFAIASGAGNQECVTWAAEDNSSGGANGRAAPDGLAGLCNFSASVTQTITFGGFGSNQFSITPSASSTNKMIFLVLGGDDIVNVAVHKWQMGTSSGDQDITVSGLGWTPNAQYTISHVETSTSGITGCRICHTATDGAGNTRTFQASGYDNGGTTFNWTRHSENFFWLTNYHNHGAQTDATWVQWIANGMRLNYNYSFSAFHHTTLFMELADPDQCFVGHMLAPSSSTPPNRVVTKSVGHNPKGLIAFNVSAPYNPASTGDDQRQANCNYGVGFSDLDGDDMNQHGWSEDNVSTSNVMAGHSATRSVTMVDGSGSISEEAVLAASGTDVEATFDTASGTQRAVMMMSFGEVASGDVTVTPSALTLNGNLVAPGKSGRKDAAALSIGSSIQQPIPEPRQQPATQIMASAVQTPTEIVQHLTSELSIVSALNAPAVSTGTNATVTPSQLDLAGVINSPSLTAVKQPAAIGLLSSVQAPAVTAGNSVTTTPAALDLAGVVIAPSKMTAVLPGSVNLNTVLGTPVSVVSKLSAAIDITAIVLNPGVSAGVTTTVISLNGVLPAVTKSVSRAVTEVNLSATVQSPTVSAGGSVTIAPNVQVLTASNPAPSPRVDGIVTAATASLNASVQSPVPAPTASVPSIQIAASVQSSASNVQLQPTVLIASLSIEAPTVLGNLNATITPSVLNLIASVVQPTVYGPIAEPVYTAYVVDQYAVFEVPALVRVITVPADDVVFEIHKDGTMYPDTVEKTPSELRWFRFDWSLFLATDPAVPNDSIGSATVVTIDRIEFSSGSGTEPVYLDSIAGAPSSGSGVVHRVETTSGSWADGDAAGVVWVRSLTSAFAAADVLTFGGGSATATADTVATAISKASEDVGTDYVDVKIGGGEENADAEIECRVTTTAGQVKDQTIRVKVRKPRTCRVRKDPHDDLWYRFDFSDYLTKHFKHPADTINGTATFTATDPAGTTPIAIGTEDTQPTYGQCQVSGGEHDYDHELSCLVTTTNGGEVREKILVLEVRQD